MKNYHPQRWKISIHNVVIEVKVDEPQTPGVISVHESDDCDDDSCGIVSAAQALQWIKWK